MIRRSFEGRIGFVHVHRESVVFFLLYLAFVVAAYRMQTFVT